MIAPPSLPLSESGVSTGLALLLLALLAPAGVALLNTGLGRSRSAAQSLLGCLVLISASVLVFALLGTTLADGSAGAGHISIMFGKPWNWAGTGPWAMGGIESAPARAQLAALFEFVALALVVLIPWGAGADRWRIAGGAACSALLAAFVFPLFAHWAWGGGWLAQLGTTFSLGAGFLDVGGAASIHVLGGLSALSVVWITGPRRGKFPKEGLSTAMPGHNAVYILFGCLVSLVGWLAFNMAGAVLWLDTRPSALPLTAINTVLAASAALVATFTITRVRFGKPDASLCANGWLSGLVTSSACASLVSPAGAIFTGLVAGAGIPLLVEFLELAISLDDPSGAISVHAASGLWGLIAAGIFAPRPGQLLAQLIGIAALLGLILPVTYLLFALLNRFVPFRVDPDGERVGMDLHELGGGAYPEFVVHRDDSYR
jgi:Amt family ammonium transporter